MAKTVTNDVETLRKYLVAQGLDAVAPTIPDLDLDQQRRLVDGEVDEVFARLRPALLRQDVWDLGLPDWYATKYSYGLQHKRQVRERLFKRAFPETLHLRLDHEIKALPDGALLSLLSELGILPSASVAELAEVCETTQQQAPDA